jgi:hypothetical protein
MGHLFFRSWGIYSCYFKKNPYFIIFEVHGEAASSTILIEDVDILSNGSSLIAWLNKKLVKTNNLSKGK